MVLLLFVFDSNTNQQVQMNSECYICICNIIFVSEYKQILYISYICETLPSHILILSPREVRKNGSHGVLGDMGLMGGLMEGVLLILVRNGLAFCVLGLGWGNLLLDPIACCVYSVLMSLSQCSFQHPVTTVCRRVVQQVFQVGLCE